ncbi:MAG: sensor domain-containing protein [Mycobacterium sp.]|nr:sensor domain-containing protein [Mycobacterium sp.]
MRIGEQILRRTAIVAGVMVLAACGVDGTPVSAGQPGAPAPAAPTVAADRVDALLVPVSAVPGGLDPAGSASSPSTMSLGCVGDDASWFGPTTEGFRSARYSGVGNRYVAQAVGVYSSADEAASVFQAGAQRVRSCGSDSLFIDAVSADRADWHFTGTSAVSGATGTMAGYTAGVVDNVVYRVSAGLFDDPVAVANSVAGGIIANVRAG